MFSKHWKYPSILENNGDPNCAANNVARVYFGKCWVYLCRMSTQLTKCFFWKSLLKYGKGCMGLLLWYVFFPIQLSVNFHKTIPVMKSWSVTGRVQMMVNILERLFSFMVLLWIAVVFSIVSLEVALTACDDVEICRVMALVSSCEWASWAQGILLLPCLPQVTCWSSTYWLQCSVQLQVNPNVSFGIWPPFQHSGTFYPLLCGTSSSHFEILNTQDFPLI